MKDNWISQIAQAPKIKKHSQAGEEGYINFILDNIGRDNKFLVDIGASDGGSNSNSRLFLDTQDFTGILIDGNNRGNSNIKQEWVTKDNVIEILRKYDCPEEFSFLTFDLDGNDYYIIDTILKNFRPRLVVCEINGTIPRGHACTIIYNPEHTHKGDDYYGFSFSAAEVLARQNGYRVVFQNDALNVYLVRADLLQEPDAEIPVKFHHLQYHPHNPNGKWVNV